MSAPHPSSLRTCLDRAGMWLSGLCAVHCVLGVVLVAVLGLGGGVLMDPSIHRFGLAMAAVIAGLAIGIGMVRHRRPGPLLIATAGLLFMGGALVVGHGVEEAVMTVIGVALVAWGHLSNLRHG
ncbi:MerC domain-containing protein [Altericroceibacterium endophyticum]|uniref:MerC family mercury resistance protein n=1 Tax=Altericroceibacterium endophyticum TaxID=1808508 RepID=A0A6I4T3X2_9SPHN|nr:MerC domain-containing protein [Altericroceibacterium endophyticum]MXO65607.1 MerC family mercury resistance protein [Altericroceibacterium endophyticum]